MSRLMWAIVAVALLGGVLLVLLGPAGDNSDVVLSEQESAVLADVETEPVPEAVQVPDQEEVQMPNGVAGAHDEEGEASTDENAPILGVTVDGRITDGEYENSVDVAGVAVSWAHDGQHLAVGLLSPGTGYVSIGFDPVQRMDGANFILAAVDGEEVVTRDDIGTGPFAHRADTDREGTDDILEAAGAETETGTTIEFVIPLDSGDEQDKPLVPGRTYTILVGYHASSDSFSAKHSARGSGEMTLTGEPIIP